MSHHLMDDVPHASALHAVTQCTSPPAQAAAASAPVAPPSGGGKKNLRWIGTKHGTELIHLVNRLMKTSHKPHLDLEDPAIVAFAHRILPEQPDRCKRSIRSVWDNARGSHAIGHADAPARLQNILAVLPEVCLEQGKPVPQVSQVAEADTKDGKAGPDRMLWCTVAERVEQRFGRVEFWKTLFDTWAKSLPEEGKVEGNDTDPAPSQSTRPKKRILRVRQRPNVSSSDATSEQLRQTSSTQLVPPVGMTRALSSDNAAAQALAMLGQVLATRDASPSPRPAVTGPVAACTTPPLASHQLALSLVYNALMVVSSLVSSLVSYASKPDVTVKAFEDSVIWAVDVVRSLELMPIDGSCDSAIAAHEHLFTIVCQCVHSIALQPAFACNHPEIKSVLEMCTRHVGSTIVALRDHYTSVYPPAPAIVTNMDM